VIFRSDEFDFLKISIFAFVSQFEKVRKTISNIYIIINNMIFETYILYIQGVQKRWVENSWSGWWRQNKRKIKGIKILNSTVFELEVLKGYTRSIETEVKLRLRIMEAAETIRNILGVFERTGQSFLRRCQSCIDVWRPKFWTFALATI